MWGSKRSVKNAAVIDMPQPPAKAQNVTYDNRVPWVGIILILFVCFVMLFPFVWWSGVYVFNQYGMSETEARRAMATTVIGVSVIVFTILIMSAIGRLFLNNILEHRERMEQYRLDALQVTLEAERYRQITAQAQPMVNRATEKDKRWCWIITAVMFKAYDYYATSGRVAGNSRPWARRQVLAIRLRDGSTPTENEAGQVRGWLEKKGIVRDDQINIDRFPDLAAVEAVLNRIYNIPVQVMVNDNTLLRSNDGYQHI